MTRRILFSPWSAASAILVFAVAVAAIVSQRLIWAQEDAAAGAPAVAEEDLLPIPEGDAKTLEDFIHKLTKAKPEGETEEEQTAYVGKALRTLVAATGKWLEAKPTDDQAAEAYSIRMMALQGLVQLDEPKAEEKLAETIAAARADKRESVSAIGWQTFIVNTTNDWPAQDAKTRKAFLDEILAKVKADGPQPLDARIVLVTAMKLDRVDDEFVTRLLSATLPHFKKSDDQEVQEILAQGNFEGMLRRLKLPGQPMEISGTLLDGKEVDWKAYRGKVVLVDFWATWCHPCRAEVPNMLEMYEAYHDKGFEVLGISLDDMPEDAEKYIKEAGIPWPTMFSQEEDQRGMAHPLASYYGITGIPTAILVGQDGRVVHMEARDAVLREQLQKLLGDPAKKPAEKK